MISKFILSGALLCYTISQSRNTKTWKDQGATTFTWKEHVTFVTSDLVLCSHLLQVLYTGPLVIHCAAFDIVLHAVAEGSFSYLAIFHCYTPPPLQFVNAFFSYNLLSQRFLSKLLAKPLSIDWWMSVCQKFLIFLISRLGKVLSISLILPFWEQKNNIKCLLTIVWLFFSCSS